MRKYFYLLIFVAILLISCQKNLKEEVYVKRVIDGDTIIVGNEKIRLLGINAPERYQPCYEESKRYLESLIKGRKIRLEFDKYLRDEYGRILAWVWVNDTLINEKMVRDGYAKAYIMGYEKYSREIIEAENYAYKNGLGCLWKKSRYFNCIKVHEFSWDPIGRDEYNLNMEYVTLKNYCNYTINLSKWLILDEANNMFIFPNVYLKPKDYITIHTGCDKNGKSNLFWCSNKPIWNNDGDTLYLFDSDGYIVLRYSYR